MDYKTILIIAGIIVITLMNIEDFVQNREKDKLQHQVDNLELKVDSLIKSINKV